MSAASPAALRYAVIGAGRLGQALVRALREANATVAGPLGRGVAVPACDVVLICVPESAIAGVAASIGSGPIVGHCSASFPMDALAPHERLVAHPLLPVTKAGANFDGAVCATDGSTPRAIAAAEQLALLIGMRPVHIPANQRALYHAAASMTANFLTTLGDAAERLAAPCGINRADLAPLIRAATENWIALGGKQALVGPVARGENATVAKQRAAVAETAPELLPLWDALVASTQRLAGLPVTQP
ncbi:MAG: DUF2520 domain-containing protein [Gemmatimonas sp.]